AGGTKGPFGSGRRQVELDHGWHRDRVPADLRSARALPTPSRPGSDLGRSEGMTRMRRRFAALVLVPFFVIAACGGSGGGSSSGKQASSACPTAALKNAKGPVKITFWYSGLKASNVDAL